MIALVGGAALPGKIGSSDNVDEAPREESLTYLLDQYVGREQRDETHVAAVYS